MPTNSNSANRRLIPALLVAVKLQEPAGSSPAMPLETARCCRDREVPFPQREIRGVLFTQVLPGNGDCQKRGRHCRRLSDTPPPQNSVRPLTTPAGRSNNQPPIGSTSPGSTWCTSKGRPTAKPSATPNAGSWITTPGRDRERNRQTPPIFASTGVRIANGWPWSYPSSRPQKAGPSWILPC